MSRVQSVLFDEHVWSINDARRWLLNNGFIDPKVDITNKYYRFRQYNPTYSERYRIKKINSSISFIIGY